VDASIWLGIVAPISAIAGVFIGAVLTRRREDERWRLDAKLKVYGEMAVTSYRFQQAVMNSAQDTVMRGEREVVEVTPEFRAAAERFFDGMPELAIIAAGEVYDGARSLAAGIVQLVAASELDVAWFLEAHEDLSGRQSALLDAMRADLGFGKPQLHVGWRDGDPVRR
jgi:hypothetical protein